MTRKENAQCLTIDKTFDIYVNSSFDPPLHMVFFFPFEDFFLFDLLFVSLRIFENDVTILNDKLHSNILGVHIRHLTLNAQVAHNCRGKDDSKVLW